VIDVGYAALSSVSLLVLSSHNSFTSFPLHYHLHGFEVVSLHFEVGDRAVPLCGFDSAMTEQILDGNQICIGFRFLFSYEAVPVLT
jgi:hypothetical protein